MSLENTPPVGFVYILSNSAFPNYVKIGYTTKDPTLRAKELDTTGLPTPFVVEYVLPCACPHLVEKAIHNTLSSYRVSSKREFFAVSIQTAKIVMREHALPQDILEELQVAQALISEKLSEHGKDNL